MQKSTRWVVKRWNVVALVLPMFLAIGPTETFAQAASKGQWGRVFKWPNVGIHVHVLPNGNVLFWGRRKEPKDDPLDPVKGLNFHDTVPWLWDRTSEADFPSPAFQALPHPMNKAGNVYNLFCSGHSFMADGRLLVVGGHNTDSHGLPHATIFDPEHNTWTGIDDMKGFRWYPTAVTLGDGRVLVSSGSDHDANVVPMQEITSGTTWSDVQTFDGLPLYPRLHLAPNGNVFMNAWIHQSDHNPDQFEGGYLLDVNAKQWTQVDATHNKPFRDYFSSVMYDSGRVLVAGGGSPPLRDAEIIDLKATPPKWVATAHMRIARRQHNATILPDGTVLVTGGTAGNGFNNLDPQMVARTSELWDPRKGPFGQWSDMADESVDRCYHSTAVLLPDARVLSAGGGEYSPNNDGVPNPQHDTHANAQIFSPPYLFNTTLPRPDILSAPASVSYGSTFNAGTSHPSQVGRVSWVRLSSVTHSFNSNQRINFLDFSGNATSLTITAPAKPDECPPGHYMLFVLNSAGVPSIAKVIRIHL